MKQDLIRRLIAYAQVDTQSDENSETCPSTPGQLELARQLAAELKEIGLTEVSLDDNGYVMATLPATTDKPAPTIGFLAHMDTSPDLTGTGVRPQIVEGYDGGDIVLDAENGILLSPREFPELAAYKGQTLITTDGRTLLGADDKAGIAEIMTAMAYLAAHPEIPHGKVRVGFLPDEEIGRGPHRFDVAAFDAQFAYTMDGGPLGELEYESFNAAQAVVTIQGKSVHPGTAKGKMINSAAIGMAFHGRLPAGEVPEFTEGYEGFYHLSSIEGTVDKTRLKYIIRDFDRQSFENRKSAMETIADEFRQTYGKDSITLELTDQYYNMREKIEPVMEIVELARQALLDSGVEPIIKPIRGGTDGSQLSYMGLPTPNIFAGGENFHGRYEFVSAESMEKAAEVIIRIVALAPEQA
ncbi:MULTISPECIES: peptidase T [unclassified Paenibacillus]|uniref:peptidase T n=1 Tax=unclassified Paenibacillus TaxID=185978 RepID=UPI0009709A1E|nr:MULTISPECIES: peptidase T [unclassified Paenibacillus]ASS69334.1 peptidase T [Paenibacillus sp. RUD330]